MDRNFTAAQLVALLEQLQTVFDTAGVTDGEDAPHGMAAEYVSNWDGTDCVLSCPITVDGLAKCLRISSRITGETGASSEISAREVQLYKDDMHRDFVTGVYNRRYWEETFARRLAKSAAGGTPVAVALVKIDGYAEIVRAHGQPVADQLVCYVANQWKKYYDEGDDKVVCRMTGHTFAVGCVGAEEIDLENQMRVLYSEMQLVCTATVGMLCRVPFTLSIACAGTEEVSDKIWPELYMLADRRLRTQRNIGGNGIFAVHH